MAYRNSFDVIYKGWLKKGTKDDQKKKGFLRSSTRWKKKYCALCKVTENGIDIAYMCIFDKEINVTEISKDFLKLWPHYRVSKKHDPSGKNHIFEVKTPEEVIRFMAESVTIMDLWVFYIQIQTKMHPDFAGEVFEVAPVDSDSMRRIGAKGSRCLIHLSKWGFTLALKRTRVVVAQWPLKCVREFESSETGMFSFDAGRNSPMGQAHYAFTTNPGDDGRMYDILDRYTTEILQSRPRDGLDGVQSYQEVTEEEVIKDYESLRLATFGLLPSRPRLRQSQLPAVPPASSRSQAVPVPGRPEYNHLQRHPSEIAPEVPAAAAAAAAAPAPPKSPLRRNNSQPQLSPRAPPLPLSTHPVLGNKMIRSSSTDNLSSDGLPQMDGYTDMSPANTLERSKGPPSKFLVPAKLPPRIPLAKQPPVAGSASKSLMSKSPYYNTLVGSYENCPLISPSPADRFAFTNEGFVSSPAGGIMSPPKFVAGRNQPGRNYKHSRGLYSPTPITHTYYEHGFPPPMDQRLSQSLKTGFTQNPPPQFDATVLYAKVNKSLRKALSADNLADFTERRASVASHVSVPQRLSGISFTSDRMSTASNRVSLVSLSLEESSPLIGSLDLAGMPHNTPSWLGFRDLPSVPHNSGSPDLNIYCKTPNSNLSYIASGLASASQGSNASSASSKMYEDIEKMKMMYEEMNRRKSAISPNVERLPKVRDAVIVHSHSASLQREQRPVSSPPNKPLIMTQGSHVSAVSTYENEEMLASNVEDGKSVMRRAQSTGDLLKSPCSSGSSPLSAGKLTFLKRFQSIPSIVAAENSKTFVLGQRSNSSSDLTSKEGSPTKSSPVTWTMRKLKQHNAAKKKQRESMEKSVSSPKGQTENDGRTNTAGKSDGKKEKSSKSKSKGDKGRSRSKESDKAFSGRDGKIVTSGKTKTFTRQAAFSSTASLDTISISSHMSGRELPARPLNPSNIKEGTYEDIDENGDALSQRRFSETMHQKQQKRQVDAVPGGRRNTAPSVHPPN